MQASRLPRRVVRIAALLLLLLGWFNAAAMAAGGCGSFLAPGRATETSCALAGDACGQGDMAGCCAVLTDHAQHPGLAQALPAGDFQPLVLPPELMLPVGAHASVPRIAVPTNVPSGTHPPLYILYHRLLLPFQA